MQESPNYYYMGLCVQSCVKMCYMGQFTPSYLLIGPESGRCVPIEACRSLIAASTAPVSNERQCGEDHKAAFCVLPRRSRVTLDFSLDADGHIVTTLGAAKSLIPEEAYARALAWCILMGPTHGTLRITFLEG